MKRVICTLAIAFTAVGASMAQSNWQPAPFRLATRWAKDVSPANALKEYPRPQMVRENWTNLNGLWDYAITPADDAGRSFPSKADGQILVPYPLESALSGVAKPLQKTQHLWYRRTFTAQAPQGNKTLLHFGAVDYKCWVFLNGTEVGAHEGGYTGFTLDVTAQLKAGENELVVKVYDPTNEGVGPHGKQVMNPANIYYTPSSGIWQTVWLENVAASYISGLKFTPDIDKGILNLNVTVANGSGYTVEATVVDNGQAQKAVIASSGTFAIKVPAAKLWTPANPFLYDLVVRLKKGGKVVDEVKSYFGMRKISIGKDSKDVTRILLNNKVYFNLGTLDQGFWPDGLYTAPTDEALAFDIKAIKAMGFNTIRKHIKVEPARWYYHADKLGMLVWQDMVNPHQGLPEGAKAAFEHQSKEIVEQLHNHPAITTYVLFNEKWGQYDQERLTKWLKGMDPSRIVNGHSGEYLYVNEQLRSPSPNAYVASDIADVHSYPNPLNAIETQSMARVCGEFGGIGVFIADHQWNTSSAWGYIQEKPAALKAKYTIMQQHLKLFENEGMSGSIYTQPFDVEGEQNGLITYDREVVKIPFADLRKIHSQLNPDMGTIPDVTAKDADLTEPAQVYSEVLQQYIDGKRDVAFLKKMAMMATQAGDKPGAALAGKAYIASLSSSNMSDEDVQSVVQFTQSTKDPGFAMMVKEADRFKKVMGDRPYTVAMMNMIFKGEMEPMLQGGNEADWELIEAKIKRYGEPANEILLRAKTVAFLNGQDWKNYVPAAKAYLEKYGKNVSENERVLFQTNIDQHQ